MMTLCATTLLYCAYMIGIGVNPGGLLFLIISNLFMICIDTHGIDPRGTQS